MAAPGRHPLEQLRLSSLEELSHYLQSLVEGRLWVKVLIGMFGGILMGFLLGPEIGWIDARTAENLGQWFALPGRIFIAVVQMILIPLVFASIIRGLAANENVEELRRNGARAAVFFVIATIVAAVIGLGLGLLLHPGTLLDASLVRSTLSAASDLGQVSTPFRGDNLPEKIVNLLPTNPIDAMLHREMFSVVVFAALIGFALISIPVAHSEPLLSLLGSLQEVSMAVVRLAMRLAPVAVFGLMTRLTSQLGSAAILGLSAYVGTVLLGLSIVFSIYLFLIAAVTNRGPWHILKSFVDVLLLAFSTSSSAAVMPLSTRAAESLGVRPSISQFIIPLGTTINMTGTALYQTVATMFLAQVFGVEVGMGEIALVVSTAVAASIGTPSSPGVGLVILSTVLTSIGIPPTGISMLIGVDRILDMSRTTVNVMGDLAAAAVLDRLARRSE